MRQKIRFGMIIPLMIPPADISRSTNVNLLKHWDSQTFQMGAQEQQSFFFSRFIILTISLLFFGSSPVLSVTDASDILVLRSFKRAIDPSSIPSASYLNTWDLRQDPCDSVGKFLGVMCSYPLDNSSSRITEIQLDGVGYDGFLPQTIGNITELTVLSLTNNKFRGPLPKSIANLRKLTRLSLSENFFTGDIQVVSHLKDLRTMNLSQNRLSGSIPSNIAGLRSLTRLSLSNNGLTGRLPALNGLWQLTELELGGNQLYGPLSKLPTSLRILSVSHNILRGHISSLPRLKQLRSLDLSGNRFSGIIRHEILALPEIVHVNLSRNLLTSVEVVRFTGKPSQLHTFDAEQNLLQGRLPINLATYERLTEINLRKNRFRGLIPKEYGQKLLNSWRMLYLDDNYLSGDLPQQFSKITKRVRVNIANNCFNCKNTKHSILCKERQKQASQCARHNAGDR